MHNSSDPSTPPDLKSDRGVTTIWTKLDATYQFPDIARESLDFALQHGMLEQFSLMNVSGAGLVVPSRIIKKVLFNGEVVWPKE